MADNKIEMLIDETSDYLDSCKSSPFNKGMIVVDRQKIFDLIDEMRVRIPDEIKRSQKICMNKDRIIAQAETKANSIIADANVRHEAMIDESLVMQQAYEKANETVTNAYNEAEEIRAKAAASEQEIIANALMYVDKIMKEAEAVINSAYVGFQERSTGIVNALSEYLDAIHKDQDLLHDQLREIENGIPAQEEPLPEIDNLDGLDEGLYD